jgi:hypothetical protein
MWPMVVAVDTPNPFLEVYKATRLSVSLAREDERWRACESERDLER